MAVRTLLRGGCVVVLLLSVALTGSPLVTAAGPFTVNSTIDVIDANPGDGICETEAGNGQCTLRAAVMEANATVEQDTIILPSGTYTLTLLGADDDAHFGDLDLVESLTLQGAGRATTIIAGNVISDRVIQTSTGDYSISGVTVQGGYVQGSYGGGILTNGHLTLTDSTVRDNYGTYGGGIFGGFAQVVLVDTQVLSSGAAAAAGVLVEHSQAWFTQTVISGNATNFSGGGGLYLSTSSTARLVDTQVISNTGAQNGGGLAVFGDSTALLTRTVVASNTALDGGGIYLQDGEVQIDNSSLFDNHALGDGGGIYSRDFLLVNNSTLSGNTAGDWGGGLYAYTGTSAGLYNATVAHNLANYNRNGAGLGGGVAAPNGGVSLVVSLLANNWHFDDLRIPIPDDCWGTFDSGGFTLVEALAVGCSIYTNVGDIYGLDPLLGPLFPHNGAPPSHALLSGSPAIDAGNATFGCEYQDLNSMFHPLLTDQRGLPRHVDGDGDSVAVCDIGAYEAQQEVRLPLILR